MSAEKHPEQEELIAVFDTQEESEAWVVQGLLESAGIEAIISGLDAPQNVLPGVGGVLVRVNPEDAEAAKKLIAENRGLDPTDEERQGETSGGSAA